MTQLLQQTKHWLVLAFAMIVLSACSSAYYSAMEKVGIHKRDILVDRVEDAQDAQQQAQQQFKSALEQLSSLINFDGGELEAQYDKTSEQYQASKESAELVTKRIAAIEDVAEALFDEWADEITQYSSERLRQQSQSKLRQTQRKYQQLVKMMHKAEGRMRPVLAALKDNTLYLKHNLNAQAIGALQGEYKSIKRNVELLIKDMNSAIKQSEHFIEQLQSH